jgi:flagellar motor component MotA
LEEEVDNPDKGQVFTKYPKILKDHHALHFICDTLRMSVSGGAEPTEIDTMMEVDLETHHKENHEPIHALTTMADVLPGLGIVAAVLGVVLTMGALGGPKEQIGEKVAAALVGTFLEILLCDGIFGPLSSAMNKNTEAEGQYLAVLRMGALGFIKEMSPIMAVELARRSIPNGVRLTFQEMEDTCRGSKAWPIMPEVETPPPPPPSCTSDCRRQAGEEGCRRTPQRRLEGRLRRFRHSRPPREHSYLHGWHQELGKLPNNLLIEGHTDAKPYVSANSYSKPRDETGSRSVKDGAAETSSTSQHVTADSARVAQLAHYIHGGLRQK